MRRNMMDRETIVGHDITESLSALDEFLVEELETRLEMQACVYRDICVEQDWLGNCIRTVSQVVCP
jgi:hypothetical protein